MYPSDQATLMYPSDGVCAGHDTHGNVWAEHAECHCQLDSLLWLQPESSQHVPVSGSSPHDQPFLLSSLPLSSLHALNCPLLCLILSLLFYFCFVVIVVCFCFIPSSVLSCFQFHPIYWCILMFSLSWKGFVLVVFSVSWCEQRLLL